MGVGPLSTGLATGINYADIIEGLLNLERKPVDKLKEKIDLNVLKQEAYDQLNGLALSANLSMFDLSSNSTFNKKITTSSDESVVTATADNNASIGSHTIRVAKLASAAVNLSNGYVSKTSTIGGGTLSFELGGKRLDQGTNLDDLNDSAGVQRGKVTISDSTGKSETFDLAEAITVQDALDILNANGLGVTFATDRTNDNISTKPTYNGYKIKATNSSSNTITLTDVGNGTTLSDLGFKTSSSKSLSTGKTSTSQSNIYYVTEATKLNKVNDGFGITTSNTGTNDIRFYVLNQLENSKKSVEVDLSSATDVGDVLNLVNDALFDKGLSPYTKMKLNSDGTGFEFTGTVSNFQNINDSRAATDLGLTNIHLSNGVYQAEPLLAEMNSSLIRNLKGGHGIENLKTGTFQITSKSGNIYSINLKHVVSVNDIISTIDNATSFQEVSGIQTVSTVVSGSNYITDTDLVVGSTKFNFDKLIGATVTDSANTAWSATISSYDLDLNRLYFDSASDNLTGNTTAGNNYKISYLNNELTAGINANGNGLEIFDSSSGGSTFRVDDVSGDVAKQLGLETTLSVDKALLNPINIEDDQTGEFRKSVMYVAKGSLPNGITEDDIVGRSVEHTYSSIRSVYADNTIDDNLSGKESAKIIAFDAAPDDYVVDSLTANLSSNLTISSTQNKSSLTGYNTGNEDVIQDASNLLSTQVKSGNIIGSTFNIYTTNGKTSSTIIGYDSDLQQIILSDAAISNELGNSGQTLKSTGYTISYNHKIILEHENQPKTFAATNQTKTAASSFTDTNLSTTFSDDSEFQGAIISVYDSIGINPTTGLDDANYIGSKYEMRISTSDLATNSVTVGTITASVYNGTTTTYSEYADFEAAGANNLYDILNRNGYQITETPFMHTNKNGNSFISLNDHFKITGVGEGQSIKGDNIENRIISGATLLDSLNGGKGISRNSFSITVGSSNTTINLNQTKIQTVQDLITEIKANISNVEVEINNQGDGLRFYDTSTTQTSFSINEFENGTAAKDLNILNTNLNKTKVSVSSNADFYSSIATATTYDETTAVLKVSSFSNLNPDQVIGGTISFTVDAAAAAAYAGREARAFITDYNSSTGDLTLGKIVAEGYTGGGTEILEHDITANNDIINTTTNIKLRLNTHQSDFNEFGDVVAGTVGATVSGGTSLLNTSEGTFSVDFSSTTFSNYDESQLIGRVVNFKHNNTNVQNDQLAKGNTGMIIGYDAGNSILYIQSSDIDIGVLQNLDTNDGDLSMSIEAAYAPEKHIQAGAISTASNYLRNIASAGFTSVTATVNDGTTSNTIISDSFGNLDPQDVIGSLVTIKSHVNTTKNGDVAIVTGYDKGKKAITVGSWYDSSGSTVTTTLSTNDEVYLTYESALEGAVLRSANAGSFTVAPSSVAANNVTANASNSTTVVIANDLKTAANNNLTKLIGTTLNVAGFGSATIQSITENYNGISGDIAITLDSALTGTPVGGEAITISNLSLNSIDAQISTNKRLLAVYDIDTATNSANGSDDKLIGSTITFNSNTATSSLQGEVRTVIDVIHDYGGTAGQTVVVLDEELPSAPTTTDDFTVTFNDISATIQDIDFSTGVITTEEKLGAAMGNRSFDIHPTIDGSYQKELDFFSTDTLESMVTKINNANVGVNASIINDGSANTPYRLSLISENTGEDGAVYVDSDITNFDFTLSSKAQDAKVILGDVSGSSSVLSSSTNTIVDGIAGVTLELNNVSTGPVSINIDHDKEGITDKAQTVVDEVNAILEAAYKLTALETDVEVTDANGNVTTEKQKGILFGDYSANQLINSIKSLLTQKVNITGAGSINYFSDIGISLDNTGKMFEFAQDTMTSSLNSNFTNVKDLFTYTPNITSGAAIFATNGMLQSGFDINHIRNNDSSSSSYIDTGSGFNGGKFKAGGTNEYITYNFGTVKKLYGLKLYHHQPEGLTAKYAVSSAEAAVGNASITADSNSFSVNGTSTQSLSYIQDTTFLSSSRGLIADQLVGATLTTGTRTATIVSYDSTNSRVYLDSDISAGTPQTDGYSITSASGTTLSLSYNPIVEYRNTTTGNYETYQSLSNVTGTSTLVFPNSLYTDSIRIRYDANSGGSEDFTTNGYFARLMEFEVTEAQGLGAKFKQTFSNLTDSNSGILQNANKSLSDINNTYTNTISRLTDSILKKQESLIKQFQNLELVVSNMNSQSSFLQSQLSSLPTAFSHRGNNK